MNNHTSMKPDKSFIMQCIIGLCKLRAVKSSNIDKKSKHHIFTYSQELSAKSIMLSL